MTKKNDNISAIVLSWFLVFVLITVEPCLAQSRTVDEPVFPVNPYISPAYINPIAGPGPNAESFYLQPWRGYLVTEPAVTMLRGIGIVDHLNLTGPALDRAIRLLAFAGFRSLRIEVEWGGSVDSNNNLTQPAKDRLAETVNACVRYGIRPTVLIWAHDGLPVPNTSAQYDVAKDAKLGDSTLVLSTVSGLVPDYSGISGLDQTGIMAHYLVTAVDNQTNSVKLSMPLPKSLPTGAVITVNTLKYQPFFPVGTRQFDESSGGWLQFVKEVSSTVKAAGTNDFDLEVWNELTFGSSFLSANNYYHPPAYDESKQPDFLRPGGISWQLAYLTAQWLRKNVPTAQTIWGFSATTFFHTSDNTLPQGITGETYHPYGTGTTNISPPATGVEHPELFAYIPTTVQTLPEGLAWTGEVLECLALKLRPEHADNPANWPVGATAPLRQMETEDGVGMEATNIDGLAYPNAAAAYKTKQLLRELLFNLGKGMSQINVYDAELDPNEVGFSILRPSLTDSDFESKTLQQLMSSELSALRNTTQFFDGAVSISKAASRQLTLSLESIGPQYEVFPGDATHPPLYYRDRFVFLPFQLKPSTFVAAVYVMSEDATHPPPGMSFRLTIGNVNGKTANVTLYDPTYGSNISNIDLTVVGRTKATLTVILRDVPDSPWLLKIGKG